jgi:1-acyl-sn-glycerol-3-phosphate acyltransferase
MTVKRLLYPIYQWLVYMPLAITATVLGTLLAVPTALLVSQRLANLGIAARWCQLLARLVPVKVHVRGLEHIRPDQSYVVVANHMSQFDIPVIYGYCGLDLRWVMKAEIRWIPFVALSCRAIGHIFINRSDPEQARLAINAAVGRLRSGTGVLFFPEGTRSRSGELLPFKKGAFRVAVDQHLPLLPMTVIGTRDIMAADSFQLHPGEVELVIHPPLSTAGKSVADIPDLIDRSRNLIASALPNAGQSA